MTLKAKPSITYRIAVNQRIRAREVLLIGEGEKQLGILPLGDALQIAREHGLDLVEVAPTAKPPVCRLLDYGKYKYEQAKKERELRKSQKIPLLREVRLRPKIDDHDLEAKTRLVKKLLDGGDKVKVTVMFRGREITHPEIGWKLLQGVVKSLEGVASLERQPVMDGKRMLIILSPVVSRQAKVKEGVKKT